MIAAFEGWNDAGEAASAAVINHLGTAWDATPIGEIDPEDYYDFQVTRPVLEVADGQTDRLVWPTTRLALAKPAGPGPGHHPGARHRAEHALARRSAASWWTASPSSASSW